jgi:2-polyprenyl-6-methoxyphenol hydroxylase-like FAD-dependent oxidoreductase
MSQATIETGTVARPDHDPRCCIAGCGPAGAMLAYLLARAGVDVLVLEKHGDFLRDFRGDTIHPSTLEILDELGLAERFLELPHHRVAEFAMRTSTGEALRFSVGGLPTKYPFIAFVPQWDFLSFMTAEARRFPAFRLLMNAEVTGLVLQSRVVRGVRYRTADGDHEARALLTIGADGRQSRTRDAIGLPRVSASPPMDVLWFRLSRRPQDDIGVQAVIGPGHFIAMLDRGDYWQVGYTIGKGQADRIRDQGLDAFRRSLASLVPALAGRVHELEDWDQIKLLTVRADRLTRWYAPGFLAIGDAAHAMSPVAGVGINVAIQDAVAAANVLWKPLRAGAVPARDLAAVQRRRELAVRVTQAMQEFVQRQLLARALASSARPAIPPLLRLAMRTPGLRTLLPRLVAFGVNRQHVETPATAS